MSSYCKAWLGCKEEPTISVTSEPRGLGFQMTFSECLFGDRKLNATDQGPSVNRLSALTTYTDLELIKQQIDS